MHAQIRSVVNTMGFRPGKVIVRLSAGESTPLGKLVGRLYYNTRVLDCMLRDEHTGYPNNGGEHTLELYCKPLDAIEMIEMFKEVALERLARTEEEREVANQLSYISQEIHKARAEKKM